MPKKTFATAPKPKLSDDQISAFETGGTGHDSKNTPDRAQQEASEPTKRLSLDLPASLHTRFKTACSATGQKMGGELQRLIEQRTAELEDEAGLTRK